MNKNIKDKSKGKDHDKEHHQWSRRSFLQTLGLAGGGAMMLGSMPLIASSLSPLTKALSQVEGDRVLVLIRLKGGNDGLNTIIPIYDYGSYESYRPNIKITGANSFNLSPDFAMPNYMNPLQNVWNAGSMKVIHGVGYQDQNLSHFRSSDIWATSSVVDDQVDAGWLGRYYENIYSDYLSNPPEIPAAIQIGSIGNPAFLGTDNTNYAFTVSNPQELSDLAENGWLHDVENVPECFYGEQVSYLRAISNSTVIYAGGINEAYQSSVNAVEYNDSPLSRQLALVARLIKGGLGTKVYMVTLDGYDTHAEQPSKHEDLMTDVSNAINDFYADLAAASMDDKVLGMTFSEFGRRVYENASEGTDHGAAAPVMLFGPALNGNGFVGEHPDLNDLDTIGNLKYGTDFRQVYATIMQDWLCIDPSLINEALLDDYEPLNLGFECIDTSVSEFRPDAINHQAIYSNNDVLISYTLPISMDVKIQIYNVMGQMIYNRNSEMKFSGNHKLSVKNNAKKMAHGQYTYQIIANGRAYSKSFVIGR